MDWSLGLQQKTKQNKKTTWLTIEGNRFTIVLPLSLHCDSDFTLKSELQSNFNGLIGWRECHCCYWLSATLQCGWCTSCLRLVLSVIVIAMNLRFEVILTQTKCMASLCKIEKRGNVMKEEKTEDAEETAVSSRRSEANGPCHWVARTVFSLSNSLLNHTLRRRQGWLTPAFN